MSYLGHKVWNTIQVEINNERSFKRTFEHFFKRILKLSTVLKSFFIKNKNRNTNKG